MANEAPGVEARRIDRLPSRDDPGLVGLVLGEAVRGQNDASLCAMPRYETARVRAAQRQGRARGRGGYAAVSMIFSKRYRYRFGDIDDAGIAYYPRLLHYFHCAMEDWWSEGLGTSYRDVMHLERFGLPAVNLEAEFFEPIRYGD